MKGMISDILPFSVNDGPGIRTCIFLKGCPLRCAWCHNPENQEQRPQAMVMFSRCTGCGACAVCPAGARGPGGAYDAARCTGCGRCAAVCPAGACRISGYETEAAEAAAQAARDRAFFRKRGGVTLTGGEPMAQPDFAAEIAGRLQAEGIHVAMETSGFASWEQYEEMLSSVNLFLYDWKVTDPEEHRRWTGVDNRLILENLTRLQETGAEIILRCPIIPGVNDTREHFEGIGGLTKRLPRLRQVDLLPYHALGNDKRGQMSLPPDGFRVPDEETAARWYAELQKVCSVPVRR